MDIKSLFLFGSKKDNTQDIISNHIKSMNSIEASDYKPYQYVREVWDGEKRYGELGVPIDYISDFRSLSIRSWQSFYTSDIAQTIIKNYLYWIVGSGLNLQCEPLEKPIKSQDKNFDRDSFVDDVELLWKLYSNNNMSSYSNMSDINRLAWEAQLNAIIGGDVLCIMRYENGSPNIELIDGLHISTPFSGNWLSEAKARGNKIKYGVEVDNRGKHVAYYVRGENGQYSRISAYHSKTKRPIAWMVYGFKYRIGDTRGMPLLGVVLEEIKKLGRYKEAILGSAEERAKVAWFISHGKNSTGENPMLDAVANAIKSGNGTDKDTEMYEGDETARKIASTTGKQVFNMPTDSELKSLSSESESQFQDFFTPNFDIICSSLGIPPEVALGKYNSNYSASRMAVKTWEHKILIDRSFFAKMYYKPIYWFWLDMSILKGDITANGYILSKVSKNTIVQECYKNCEFEGINMPHVDPYKEVMAERKKLGNETIPLTSLEKSTKRLNDNDWRQNITKHSAEMKLYKKLGFNTDSNE